MIWLILAIPHAMAGECTGPATTPQDVKTHVDDAMLAFATLDEEGVVSSFGEAEKAIPCLNAVMAPTDVASYHRLVGIKAFLDGDDDAAVTAFQAASFVQPDYVLSTKIAPEGGKLRRLFDKAAAMPDPLEVPFTAPAGQTGYVDGATATERPATVPAIVQFVDASGHAKWSDYVPAGGYLPTDRKKPEPAPVKPAPAPEPIAAAPEPAPSDDGFPSSGDDGFPSSGDDGFPSSGDDGFPSSGDDGFPPDAPDDGVTDIDEPTPRPKPARPEPVVRPDPTPKPKPIDTSHELTKPSAGGGHSKGTFTALAITTGVLTAGAIGTTFGARSAFDKNPSEGLYYTTNGAYFGSIGLGALTAGFAIGAIASPGSK